MQSASPEHVPRTLDELRRMLKPIRNVFDVHRKNLSILDRGAIWITEHVGSMGFFAIVFLWTASWLSWNTLAPTEHRFDPYPAFVLWLFISNLIQLFLLPLLLIGQNLQTRYAETRANVDYEINVKSEKEIETVLVYLEHQHALINDIHRLLKEKQEKTPEAEAYAGRT
jgi:uncharacterized membrane protein